MKKKSIVFLFLMLVFVIAPAGTKADASSKKTQKVGGESITVNMVTFDGACIDCIKIGEVTLPENRHIDDAADGYIHRTFTLDRKYDSDGHTYYSYKTKVMKFGIDFGVTRENELRLDTPEISNHVISGSKLPTEAKAFVKKHKEECSIITNEDGTEHIRVTPKFDGKARDNIYSVCQIITPIGMIDVYDFLWISGPYAMHEYVPINTTLEEAKQQANSAGLYYYYSDGKEDFSAYANWLNRYIDYEPSGRAPDILFRDEAQFGDYIYITLRDDTVIDKDGNVDGYTSTTGYGRYRANPDELALFYEDTIWYKNGVLDHAIVWFDTLGSSTYYEFLQIGNNVYCKEKTTEVPNTDNGTYRLVLNGRGAHEGFNLSLHRDTLIDGDKLFKIKDNDIVIVQYESTVNEYKKACKKLPKYSKIKKNAAKYNGKSYKMTATVVGSGGFGDTWFLHVTTKSGDFIVATNEQFTDWDKKTHKYQAGDKVTVYFTVTGYGTLNDAGYGNLKFAKAYQKATKQYPNLWILPEDNSQYTPSQSVVFGIAKAIEKKSK